MNAGGPFGGVSLVMDEPKEQEERESVGSEEAPEAKEDVCPLCEGTGVFSAVEPVPGKVYLCGACERGDTENCSGWCGVRPFPVEGPTANVEAEAPEGAEPVGKEPGDAAERSEPGGFEIEEAFWSAHSGVERWHINSNGSTEWDADNPGDWIQAWDYCRDLGSAERQLGSWENAAKAVGVSSPGGMQQARHMATMACAALELHYDETSPGDIREAIETINERARRAESKAAKAQMLLKEDGEMEEKLLTLERELDGVEKKLDAANRRNVYLEQNLARLRDYANLKDLSEDAPRARAALKAAYARANAAEGKARDVEQARVHDTCRKTAAELLQRAVDAETRAAERETAFLADYGELLMERDEANDRAADLEAIQVEKRGHDGIYRSERVERRMALKAYDDEVVGRREEMTRAHTEMGELRARAAALGAVERLNREYRERIATAESELKASRARVEEMGEEAERNLHNALVDEAELSIATALVKQWASGAEPGIDTEAWLKGREQSDEAVASFQKLTDHMMRTQRAFETQCEELKAALEAAETQTKKADARIAELEQLEDSLLKQKRCHEVNEELKVKFDEAERDKVMLFDECQRLKRLYGEMKARAEAEGKAANEPNECEELKARVAELLEEAECATAREVSLCEAANQLGARVMELEAELRTEQAAHDRNDRSHRERLVAAEARVTQLESSNEAAELAKATVPRV